MIGNSLAIGVADNSDADIYEGAMNLRSFLSDSGINLSLSETEFYALIKLAAPALVDTSAAVRSGRVTTENIDIITPAMSLIGNIKVITVTHQFDVAVAGLRLICTNAPTLDSLDVGCPDVTAGASIAELEAAMSAAAFSGDVRGESFVSGSAVFLGKSGSSDVIDNNSVYYVEYKLRVAGPEVPSSFVLTLNGKTSIKPCTVEYVEGAYVVTGIFKYVIGSPVFYTLSFDNCGHGSAVDSILAANGTLLKYEFDQPVFDIDSNASGSWKYNGWTDGLGNEWDDIKVNSDVTLKANWKALIDNVDISFVLPSTGEGLGEVTVPDGAHYYVKEAYLLDSTWDGVDEVHGSGRYIVSVILGIDEDAEAHTVQEDVDVFEYVGTFSLNGEVVEVDYDTIDAYYQYEDQVFSFSVKFDVE